MNEFYEDAKGRMPSQKSKILNLLRESKEFGVTNTELNVISFRYSDRLYQLKLEGYEIRVENNSGGLCTYYLISEPTRTPNKPKKGIDLLLDEIDSRYKGCVTTYELHSLLEELNLNLVRKPNTLRAK